MVAEYKRWPLYHLIALLKMSLKLVGVGGRALVLPADCREGTNKEFQDVTQKVSGDSKGGIHQSIQAGITQGDIHIIIQDPRLVPNLA